MYTAADVHELVKQLNTYRNAYYNNDESLVSDKEYDKLYDELFESVNSSMFRHVPISGK